MPPIAPPWKRARLRHAADVRYLRLTGPALVNRLMLAGIASGCPAVPAYPSHTTRPRLCMLQLSKAAATSRRNGPGRVRPRVERPAAKLVEELIGEMLGGWVMSSLQTC